MRSWRNWFVVPMLVMCLGALAACGSSSSGSSSSSSSSSGSGSGGSSSASSASTPSADPAVAKLVPASIKSKGTLTVAADASYAPDEFFAPDGHTIIGMDADLAKALAGVMGLKADVVNAGFDAIIPGLAAHKYDLGASSFTDTKEREKTVDFVTYFSAGTSFYVKAQGGPNITSLASLCGHSVAVEKGTTQQADVEKQAKKCHVNLQTFPDQNGANLALSSGRAEVGMADSPVADYQVKKSNGKFKLSGQPYGTAPYGIAIPKDSGLQKPVLAAMKALQADGTYMKILKKWGVQDGAISDFKINGAIS
jgi:polar amino acid transport system substrate-binding protein